VFSMQSVLYAVRKLRDLIVDFDKSGGPNSFFSLNYMLKCIKVDSDTKFRNSVGLCALVCDGN